MHEALIMSSPGRRWRAEATSGPHYPAGFEADHVAPPRLCDWVTGDEHCIVSSVRHIVRFKTLFYRSLLSLKPGNNPPPRTKAELLARRNFHRTLCVHLSAAPWPSFHCIETCPTANVEHEHFQHADAEHTPPVGDVG
jgi:hypothetical protein